MSQDATTEDQASAPRWQPIAAIDRRVAGVLVEKAKTTPSAYPMSLNAIVTACNQKSNRSPVMNLEPEDVEESLERLRGRGAVGMVEGYGRVTKYRHYLYDWLGVDKVEIAVMAELLLRGAQTVGELRGRAARMEQIRDLSELQPIVVSLKSKGLVISLTPEGRGHVVTHALYERDELERVKESYAGQSVSRPRTAEDESGPPAAPASSVPSAAATEALQRELAELRDQIAQLRSDLDDLAAAFQQTDGDLRRLKEDLGT
jgi:uncharacterized protein YceH (UPF0502 family)